MAELEQKVYKIVLTGGPCGGKTTSASLISDRLEALGWKVYRVPEAATLLFTGGFTFQGLDHEQIYDFQLNLVKTMMALEDSFHKIAKSSREKSIVLCDRGVMDASAYMDAASWERLLREVNETTVEVRDGRYDCVIHLMTAAEGAEKFYENETNTIRLEPAEQARDLDRRIREAWIGHPYLNVIDNRSDFERKIARVLEVASKHIGVGAPGRVKRKFLVSGFVEEKECVPVKHETYEVVHYYLVSDDNTQLRLRKRGQDGIYTYSLTTRFEDIHGQRLELKRELNSREFHSLRLQADYRREIVRKKRISFLYNAQYFELDVYNEPKKGLMLLESYMSSEGSADLPSFLKIEKEVTGEPTYSMYFLSLKPSKKKK